MNRKQREGFSLVEVVIAVAVGAVVIGGGMLMYFQGNKYFYKATEHTTFRSEALLLTERIAEDLAQLQVSAGKRSDGKYWLVQPYDLKGPPGEISVLNEAGTETEKIKAGNYLRFPRFHHVEMRSTDPGIPAGVPTMVARMMEYKTEPVDPSDESKGVNLLRNGKKINTIPLRSVLFFQEPAIVAANQVQGSPHAIVSVVVIPEGGAFGNMDHGTIERLAKDGAVVKRTYHLVGYESFYTSILFSGLQKTKTGEKTYENLDALTKAVVKDAKENVPGNLMNNVETAVDEDAAPTYAIPQKTFAIEENVTHDDSTKIDESWLSIPTAPGRASGKGPWEGFTFEDNGAGPGSGSGGSGSSNASGSGSGGSGSSNGSG